MLKKKKSLLQLPQGTESFLLEEAYKHRQIRYQLDGLFTSWGYLPVETPVFDFFDIYQSLFDEEEQKKIYRLLDREGDLLMLRSDITLFLAKQMSLHLNRKMLPARVYYSDTILRHQMKNNISNDEFFQTGAELIGDTGTDGDLEILLLLINLLSELGTEFTIHIGSRELLNSIFKPETGERLSGPEIKALIESIQWREFQRFESIISDYSKGSNWKSPHIRSLWNIFTFIGTPEVLQSELNDDLAVLEENSKTVINSLIDLYATLIRMVPENNISLDLSEVGSQPYYTGIVFQAYMPGMNASIASGGRYDRLFREFGFDSPSVGFSLMLRKIEDSIEMEIPFSGTIPRAPGDSIIHRYAAARKAREKGEIVTL